tara:strand:+ start:164 stop:2977 length:2814 start_codon:yes stop_codon:yes gene_type:complete
MHIILIENDKLNYFNNAHTFLIKNGYGLSTSNSFLEIIVDNSIYKITDESKIKNYRKTNNLPDNNSIIKYTITTHSEKINEEYDNNAKIQEIEIEYNEITKEENIKDLQKQFRMKKELIYKKSNDSGIHFKCEIISEQLEFTDDFSKVVFNIKNPKYVYSAISEKEFADTDYYIRLLHFMLDSNIIQLKKEIQKSVLENYKKLVLSMFSKYARSELGDNIVMITPKPATLEKHNLASIEEFGVITILENYAVSEKADGERYLLYVDDNSKVYLIDGTNKQVRGCNIETDSKNCLLDGELVLCHNLLKNNSKDLFAIFDIYYYNNEKVSNLPLIDDTNQNRYNLMNTFLKSIKKQHSHKIIVKQQLTSDNIFDNCDSILSNKDDYDYDIDGLIFTPIKIPVFGYYANKPVELNNGNNLTWNRVLKWKPPELNTIDFIVIEKGYQTLLSDGKKYKVYSLNVVLNSNDMENISVKEGLNYSYNNIERKTHPIYSLKQYNVDNLDQFVYIPTDKNDRCFTENKEEILNNSVVEFAYNKDTELLLAKERRWRPLRIRHDKNKIYNFGEGILNKTANTNYVAMNIWRSINDEITSDMICGKQSIAVNVKKYLTGLDVYYKRPISSFNLISYKMNLFHNHVIKAMLYETELVNSNKTLLELACGQAADLQRWMTNNFTHILGIDYTLDNITNPISGAYSRVINYNYSKRKSKIIFAAGDCHKNIRDGSAAVDTESKELLLHLFKNKKSDGFNYVQNFPKQFNLISCMFSVHYFFETEKMLDGFIRNVVENIDKNGKFILTFMDKDLVKKILDENNGTAIGKDLNSGAVIWAIIKKYNDNSKLKYGQKIDVYIENTGRLITENLVDFNVLKNKLSEHKIILEDSETFEKTFKDTTKKLLEIKNPNNYQKKKIERQIDIINNLNEDNNLKQFSFLNRWCIFKKQEF